MPNRRIPDYWRKRVIKYLDPLEGRLSDREIRKRIKAEADGLQNHPDPEMRALASSYPSERTISRIRKDEYPELSKDERVQLRTFYWPESMEQLDLPWEASAAGLELLRFCHEFEYDGMKLGRPDIRLTRRFWQATLAAPDAEVAHRFIAAAELVLNEPYGPYFGDKPRSIEWYFAYSPWRSDEDRERYVNVRRVEYGREYQWQDIEPIPEVPGSWVGMPKHNALDRAAFLATMVGLALEYKITISLSKNFQNEQESIDG